MYKAILVALVLLVSPALATAQEGSKQAPRAANKLSVAGGIGFLSSIQSLGGPDQFLMQFDGLYNLTNNFAVGSVLQVGPASRSSTVAMSFEGRFYVPLGDGEGVVGRLAPYVGAGLGFRSYTGFNTEFLFPIIAGLEYDLTDNLALTSDMRFNITSGLDNFYYSWQLVGARLRF